MTLRAVGLADGRQVPALGQGTWRMGSDGRRRDEEIAALRLGFELGLTLVDTAEMYGDGDSERLVGEAMRGLPREQVFVVSKVLPSHAGAAALRRSCEASLRRLGIERIDLYLLHWRGGTPLAETVEGFEGLRRDGKIAGWGVSNFDVSDMEATARVAPERACLVDQVLYNLDERGIEHDLLGHAGERDVAIMAYSPVAQAGAMLRHPVLAAIGHRHGRSPAQVALAWTLRHRHVISIPKAARRAHVRENADALSLTLDDEDLAALDEVFPPPRGRQPLAIL